MPFLPPARSALLIGTASVIWLSSLGFLAPTAEAQNEGAPAEAVPPAAATPPSQLAQPPAKVAAKPVEAAPVANDKRVLVRLDKSQPDGRMFGKYRIRIGIAKPKFNDGLKYYDELYGSSSGLPMLSVDYFPWDFYATLGLSFRLGYYTDDGYATKSANNGTAPANSSQVVADHNGPTSLTLIPMQFCLAAEGSPFRGKWLVLDGWIGVERLYWQETRVATSDTKTPTATPTTTSTTSALRMGRPSYLMNTTPNETDTDSSLVNSGTKTESVIGFAANILLNPLDEQSALSSRGTMGIGSVYLSPYLEIVRTIGKQGVSFGRTAMGLGFTFETAR